MGAGGWGGGWGGAGAGAGAGVGWEGFTLSCIVSILAMQLYNYLLCL